MMNRLTGLVVAALVTGLGLGFVCAQTPPTKPPGGQNQPAKGEDDDEVTIKLTDAPEAVRAAFLKLAAEKDIKKMSKETDDGLTIYEVEWESAGKSMSADVSDKGDVLSIDIGVLNQHTAADRAQIGRWSCFFRRRQQPNQAQIFFLLQNGARFDLKIRRDDHLAENFADHFCQ
jgi:hypothetical protein